MMYSPRLAERLSGGKDGGNIPRGMPTGGATMGWHDKVRLLVTDVDLAGIFGVRV